MANLIGKNKWQYNELQQVGVDYKNYDEVARYDARMKKLRDIETEINSLIEATSPTPDSVILEIGTGTGEFTLALAAKSQKLFAIDVSPAMLEYADKKAKERKIKNIEFHHAGFLTYNGSPEQFDIIFTQLALHHLPDFWKLSKTHNKPNHTNVLNFKIRQCFIAKNEMVKKINQNTSNFDRLLFVKLNRLRGPPMLT